MTVAPGDTVRSLFSLAASRTPVTDVAVILGGVAMPGKLHGPDLRSVAGLYFTAPALQGRYRWSVSATTSIGCEAGKDQITFLTVK